MIENDNPVLSLLASNTEKDSNNTLNNRDLLENKKNKEFSLEKFAENVEKNTTIFPLSFQNFLNTDNSDQKLQKNLTPETSENSNNLKLDETPSYSSKENINEKFREKLKDSVEENEELVDTNMSKIFSIKKNEIKVDKSSNLNCLQKINHNISNPKSPKVKLNQIIPKLKQIKVKFTKRENLDKKIIKFFKAFIKEKIKRHDTKSIKNLGFWNRFAQGMCSPPFNFYDEITNEYIEFKSVNSLYIIWVFQNEFSTELYNEFIQVKGENVFENIKNFFMIKENDDLKLARYYIFNFYSIFSFENFGTNINDKNDDYKGNYFNSFYCFNLFLISIRRKICR